jgi:1-acyl-sn-glycerol-3-phosphate acyltransferase
VSTRETVRRATRVAGFGAVTAGYATPFAAINALTPERERRALRDKWVARWADALLRLFAVTVEVEGDARCEPSRGRVVVANHRSTIDIAVLLRAFGGCVISRADLSGWPIIGQAARAVGTLFVDRADAASGASAVREMRARLDAKETIIVFAEGTTFSDDVVRPFHAGAFLAALHSEAEIVPVGLAYERGSGAAFVNETFPQHLARMAAADPTRVAVCVGEPFDVPPKARAAALRDRAQADVQKLVDRARARVDR